jgi:CopC domain
VRAPGGLGLVSPVPERASRLTRRTWVPWPIGGRRPGRALAVGPFLAIAAALVLAGPVSAHALLASSDPAAGSSVQTAPTTVTLTFTTFRDPAGTDLPVQSATIVVAPESGGGILPEARVLELGHFVADVTRPASGLGVDVVGAAPGGGQLHAHVEMQVQP